VGRGRAVRTEGKEAEERRDRGEREERGESGGAGSEGKEGERRQCTHPESEQPKPTSRNIQRR
jgi:hypothetical protein